MKVLFAVNNDEISDTIIKRYQKDYKEILSYKNVYYFNAILKELQKDEIYDRVVISEDLEPFANNNYDTIDKFIFDKLDSISDEAINEEGNNTEIILICTDRRNKSDDMLTKLFGIGIYNAIIGTDRSIDKVCKLINKPRTKKEAKQYYKINVDTVAYQEENEDSVSETEIQNILAHYKRIGKNEEKYVDSFNNIASQYTDTQLRIIIKYLDLSVKAVLEEKSDKYRQLVSYSGKASLKRTKEYNNTEKTNSKNGVRTKMLEDASEQSKIKGPIIIPSDVNTSQVRKLIKQDESQILPGNEDSVDSNDENDNLTGSVSDAENETESLVEDKQEIVKPKRGRPRKKPLPTEEDHSTIKRGRGRPRKIPISNEETTIQEDDEGSIDLFNLDDNGQNAVSNDEEKKIENNNNDSDVELFNLLEEGTSSDDVKNEKNLNSFVDEKIQMDNDVGATSQTDKILNIKSDSAPSSSLNTLVTKDKKVVSFVGTTKNGTSFVVNNVAHMLASMGIKTAILDMTKTRNAYYIYTNTEKQLMDIAKRCMYKLKSGIAEGIKINKDLTVYTTVPDDNADYCDVDSILSTLIKNYSVVLIDCDFDTPIEYFGESQEIYLVQTMDVLTIQPLTAFLRNLQSKSVLNPEKIRIIINKAVNIRSVSIKTIIAAISKYNDPSLTIMKQLFDKNKVPYCVIPFELQNYTKYLDEVITCTVSLKGYTSQLMTAFKNLCGMIYPLISKPVYSPRGDKYNSFPNEVNNTLNKMKKKYQ